MPGIDVSVLGAVEARLDGAVVDLGTRKQRALLAALALHRGRPVPTDTLVDLLWADRPPAQWATTLQGYVAGLRRALEPHRPARAPAAVLVTAPPGYALQVPADRLDAARFDAAVASARQRLGAVAVVPSGTNPPTAQTDPADLEATLGELDDALGLWRGAPYAELEDAPAAAAERVRLEELRLVALEDRAVVSIALGRHATVAAELEVLTAVHPLRERLWALRALALTRSGRQADALDVLRQVRDLLADELGLEPGAELRHLQAAVLRQDPALDWLPVRRDTAVVETVPSRAAAPHQTPGPTPGPVSPWPIVGRDEQLGALVGLLDVAASGTTAFAAVVGEPGIGKSRLMAALAAEAEVRGCTVLVGRCSQDDGAPPLWPWASVLAGLGRQLPTTSDTPGGDEQQFRAWDEIVRAVATAADDRPVLVLLDDLHWADPSSLRVLSLLLESVHQARLTLVASWRDRPVPTGPLAAVAEQLSRRHALRLALSGLATSDVRRVVEAVSAHRPDDEQADALRARTDGNPFFLVEYARLVDDGTDLAAALAEPDPPQAVTDVVARRLERLPEPTRTALVVAAVVGRFFDLGTVATAAGRDEDDLLDALDVAVAAGLVREDGVDRFRFAHALVRDTVYAGTSATRRARWHARVAAALEGRPGREGEVARHWHAAGPGHADRAWRADRVAAHEAMRVYAYEEARGLLEAALRTVAEEPGAAAEDLHAVQLDLGLAYRASADWESLRTLVHDAIAVAERLADPAALARVVILATHRALWQSVRHGDVDQVVIDAQRRALDRLPAADDELRCHVMTGLAHELYYAPALAEREALLEEAVAMARRLGDPRLLEQVCESAAIALWRPGTVRARAALADEALRLATERDEDESLAFVLTLRAVAAHELGDVGVLEELVARARADAEKHHEDYVLVVLDTIEVSWSTMRGDHERAARLTEHLAETAQRVRLPQAQDALAGAFVSMAMWQRRYDDLVVALRPMIDEDVLPMDTTMLAFLVRSGRVDEARAMLRERRPRLGGDTWFSLLSWSLAAEVGLGLGDVELAATAYDLLAPCSGMLASAGTGASLGPVDAFLAMAAAATGERELAARHADAALEQCRAWRAPPAEEWLLEQRDRHGF